MKIIVIIIWNNWRYILINKIKALKIVTKNGQYLKRLPKYFKKDREIVIEAVKNDGFAIADADCKLLDDKKIAVEAIKNNRNTLLLLNRKLTTDKDILFLVGLKKIQWKEKNETYKNSIFFVFVMFRHTLICKI